MSEGSGRKRRSGPKPRCFLAMPLSPDFLRVKEAVKRGARSAGFRPVSVDELAVRAQPLATTVLDELAEADCVVADISGRNANVLYELGIATGLGKAVFLVIRGEPALRELPSNLRGFEFFVYEPTEQGMAELATKIGRALAEFRNRPASARPPGKHPVVPLVDWERLDPSDAENLCLELLSQMGFVRLDWAKVSPELDLVAELPRKDPDGFEYRELWLISMGRHAPPEMLLEMAREPDYLVHRLLRRSGLVDELLRKRQSPAQVTFLLILLRGSPPPDAMELFSDRQVSSAREGPSRGLSLRIRIWDRGYLASLIQRFPQIAYKYFTDEGRSRAKFRKTPEELYKENVALAERQARLIAELEEEKNKRVRAERDAVWKDISFSAAHKIGNPIFAIETNLDPLAKRVRENRPEEAIEVIGSIRNSVEKAKAIIDQFKSLTRAQQITPTEMLLCPVLEEACETARNQGVYCTVECPSDLRISADPERLGECIDELVSNSLHWFDKPEKKIAIHAGEAQEPLPGFVDSGRKYIVIQLKDNGAGIPVGNKDRIFDAFFTTQEHGTGLGLALVRRIVEGHGGAIAESGVPGEGADFQIYLPMSGEPAVEASRRKPARKLRRKE